MSRSFGKRTVNFPERANLAIVKRHPAAKAELVVSITAAFQRRTEFTIWALIDPSR
jgi:hypothetical protein